MVIDCHTHVGEANNKVWTTSDLIKSMDEAGIDLSLIIADKSNPTTTSIPSILAAIKDHPRLKIIGDCYFKDLDISQINFLIKCLEEEKIIGVKFYLGYEPYFPDNEKLYPIYEYCQEHNKPVMYHTGALETGSQGLLKYSHPFGVDEVATRFPKLKIVMAHMGNPWLIDCAAVMHKNENVYADMSAFFEENTPIGLKDIATFQKRLADVSLFLGNLKKFIFGTDWPLYNQKEYLNAVQSLDLSPEEKDLIFWKNAKIVFNLKD